MYHANETQYHNNGAGAACAASSPADAAFSSLGDELTSLRGAIEELSSRLSSVLSPEETKRERDNSPRDAAPSAEIVRKTLVAASFAADLRLQVTELLRRLAI